MPPARTAGPAQPVQPMVASPPTGSMIPPTQSLSSATAASASSSRRPSPIYPQNHHRKYRTSPVKTTCSRSMSLERKVRLDHSLSPENHSLEAKNAKLVQLSLKKKTHQICYSKFILKSYILNVRNLIL